jgi:ferrous iron transport protein B
LNEIKEGKMSRKIALIGNPNCGKTTMFNALTGARQYVGNWPGVTVEKKEGHLKGYDDVIITDLPGIYSLSPYTLEEVVSRDYLIEEKPDAIINLVDATNIERNLYLTTQIMELGIPVVIAMNMMDIIKKRGDKIDIGKLKHTFGCEIIETSALKGTGIKEASEAAIAAADKGVLPEKLKFNAKAESYLAEIEALLPSDVNEDLKRWYSIKFFERDEKATEKINVSPEKRKEIENIAEKAESDYDDDTESIITNERYNLITKNIKSSIKKASEKMSTSDKIDRIVTNRILGLPIFVAIMFVVYYIAVSIMGGGPTDWANDTVVGEWIQAPLSSLMENAGVNDVIISLVVDGIVGGLGAVFGFLPQMAVLFVLLSILEDCGYMVRIAFVLDRIFRRFGLSGKSFIPLIIGSGCGVPGIMASKTIENDNDRRLTIMTTTFIPCGAKLPVIALIAGVICGGAWWMAPVMYLVGIVAVLVSSIILKKTKPFSGEPAPFVMELPSYHIPSVKGILIHVWEKLWGFIKKAGTILFAACVVMWFLASFGVEGGSFGLVDDQANSIMAVIGGAIAFLFIPLGFGNWQACASSISGFVAKEGIVSTIGILSGVGELAEDDPSLWSATGVMFPTAVAAISFLVFNLLDSPCLAAISTMAKELNDRKWFWFAIAYQNIFAYCVTLIIYQFGSLIAYGQFGVGTVAAIIVAAAMLFMLFRPDPYKNQRLVVKRSVVNA